ncbi:MAG: hypothetical protein ACI4NE_04165 [Succinivibrio sp.]
MFVQIRKNNKYSYVYIVESYRKDDGSVGHKTLEKVGRYDRLIEEDPNFLEKLKENVKKRGQLIKAENQIFTKVDEESQQGINATEGYHIFSYANIILRLIWKDYLKLDYRTKYIQDYHYQNINFSISEHFFHRLLESILSDVINLKSDTVHLIGDSYNQFKEMDNHAKFLEILNEQKDKLTDFISSKTAEYSNLPWLNNLSSILEDSSALDELTNSDIFRSVESSEKLAGGIRNNEGKRYFDLIKMLLIKAVYSIISNKLKETGIEASVEEITLALDNALLLPYSPSVTDNDVVYLKIAGPKVDLMDNILKAFSLEPLLNSQTKNELCNRLKIKPKTAG